MSSLTICADTHSPLTHGVYGAAIQAEVTVIIVAVFVNCIQISDKKSRLI